MVLICGRGGGGIANGTDMWQRGRGIANGTDMWQRRSGNSECYSQN